MIYLGPHILRFQGASVTAPEAFVSISMCSSLWLGWLSTALWRRLGAHETPPRTPRHWDLEGDQHLPQEVRLRQSRPQAKEEPECGRHPACSRSERYLRATSLKPSRPFYVGFRAMRRAIFCLVLRGASALLVASTLELLGTPGTLFSPHQGAIAPVRAPPTTPWPSRQPLVSLFCCVGPLFGSLHTGEQAWIG